MPGLPFVSIFTVRKVWGTFFVYSLNKQTICDAANRSRYRHSLFYMARLVKKWAA